MEKDNATPDAGCTCQGCGHLFKIDVMLPDDLWARISPKRIEGFAGGGLLCPACIFKRLEELCGFGAWKLVGIDTQSASATYAAPQVSAQPSDLGNASQPGSASAVIPGPAVAAPDAGVSMEKDTATNIIADCASMRAESAAERPMTVDEAIDEALWLRKTPDGVLSPHIAKRTILTMLGALEASPCYLKAARLGIPSFTLIAPDRAGITALRLWILLAEAHGARPEKYEPVRVMLAEWEKRTDLRWPT